MDGPSNRISSVRQSIVTTALTSMAVLFFLLLVVLIGGSYIVLLLAIVLGIAAFGALHYVLWGRLLSEQTAGEREEEQLRQRALSEDWSDEDVRRR
jgi:ABC-type bacteriocin/lantibiotic exporter with double-glycine peptidase domain